MQTILRKKIGDVDKKVPNTSCLVNTTALNTNVSEVENEILDNSISVKTNVPIMFLMLLNILLLLSLVS